MKSPNGQIIDEFFAEISQKNPEKLLPFDVRTEAALLGVLLWDRDAIIHAAPLVEPEDFFDTDHRRIYAAILSLYRRRVPPELITVQSELTRLHQLEGIGGEARLHTLIADRGVLYHPAYYADIIARHSVFRRLMQIGSEIAGLAYRTDATPDAALSEAAGLLAGLLSRRTVAARRLVDVADAVLTDLSARQHGEGALIPTGFPTLDKHVYGWETSQLILLAARTARGKTALAQHFAEAAARAGHPVAVLSLEMEPEELARRHLARTGAVDLGVLRRATAGDADWRRLADAHAALDIPIWFLPLTQPSIEQVQLAVQRLQADPTWGCDLLVVDYLQLMPSRGQTREQEVAQVSRGLKALARQCRIPVIALSQFSRAAEDRHAPELRDLRESGALEQDANVVLALHRPDPTIPQRMELHVLKQRDGEADTILPLRWQGSLQRFAEID